MLINSAHANYKRSLAKTITWRIIGSIDTFIIGYFATGEARIGLAIAGTEVVTKMVLYYFHERGWSHIKWGLVRHKADISVVQEPSSPEALSLTA